MNDQPTAWWVDPWQSHTTATGSAWAWGPLRNIANKLAEMLSEVRVVMEDFRRDIERARWAALLLRELQASESWDESRVDAMRTVLAAPPHRMARKRKRQPGSPSWARRKRCSG